ncbi:EOGT [Cordylochernes scorpioides]|uniref:EOGT n=1 Tax=Cordylochernes scorpioides TaxID=51811 RepID=A0ABY6L107_9ARAC|nr:EOGT [Cordylochernes scorpioides]
MCRCILTARPAGATRGLALKKEDMPCHPVRKTAEAEPLCEVQHLIVELEYPLERGGLLPEDKARTKDQQVQQFFEQGDFGYVKARRQELKTICAPSSPMDSHLECSAYTRFCRGQNIMMDFSSLLTIPQPMKYREDVIKEGQIGGRCQLNKKLLKSMGQHKSPLQSWYAELEHFTELPTEPIKSGKCDVVIDKPTFLMKLDAPVSMYHHFCDFLNLYLTLHLNNTFTRDVSILMWDTNSYLSNFQITWQAFTKNPLLYLGPYKGKKSSQSDISLPLDPRGGEDDPHKTDQ